jgi:predicted CXXCH cytochrome family protein
VVPRSSRCLFAGAFVAWLAAAAAGCGVIARPSEQEQTARLAQASRWGTPSVFTPAHRSIGEAFSEHFGVRPEPEQPFPFSHQIHLEKQLVCTDCHESVERGPRASIPGVNTCMICHSQIATDRPLIQQIAQMQEKGLDFAWQRVYDYPRSAHVRFEHSPHIRAGVECSTCHGDQKSQTVARRMVDMDMGFCVNCHKQKQASNDCLTCHY